MAVRIEPDGTTTNVRPRSKKDGFTLKELYRETGCDCIDIRRLADGRWLVCDDSGLLKRLPINPAATVLYNRGRRDVSTIVDTVLIAEEGEIQ